MMFHVVWYDEAEENLTLKGKMTRSYFFSGAGGGSF